MAEKRRFLDVWILQSNTVYKEVPFSVVTDWVQQGRLLEDDKVRPSGTNQWARVGSVPAFTPYVPKPEPYRVEDKAEALEPVEIEAGRKPSRGPVDEEVDMIPLIDVSLVLLVFFMMTATVGGPSSLIATPPAENKLIAVNQDVIWIGISFKPGVKAKPDEDVPAEYSIGKGSNGPGEGYQHLDEPEILAILDQKPEKDKPPPPYSLKVQLADIEIKADKDMPFDVVKKMTINLENRRSNDPNSNYGVRKIFAGVSERIEK